MPTLEIPAAPRAPLYPVRSRAVFRQPVTFATAPASAPDLSLQARFVGCLLGGMAGDTLGASVEGWTATRINTTLDYLAQLPPHSLYRGLCDGALGALGGRLAPGRAPYTDDTEMTIGVAEALLQSRRGEDINVPLEQLIAGRLATNFDGRRNYGTGVYGVLARLRRVTSTEEAIARAQQAGDGGAGNSGAARVAPIALLYHDADKETLAQKAAGCAAVTHAHPVGQAGAVLQAFAIAQALRHEPGRPLDALEFLQRLCADFECWGGGGVAAFRAPLARVVEVLARPVTSYRDVSALLGANAEGTSADAVCSVPAALYAFLRHPESLADAVTFAIRLGGDTDTVAAMAGALGGALGGQNSLPTGWLLLLEDGERGQEYVRQLADALHRAWQG